MDLIDLYGFLPNGGRKYYLNRSQPPVFVQMVDAYVKKTGNVTILERALPILETELAWWRNNRSLTVTSPFTQKNYTVYHYAANVSAPRPEGYVEDITTAFGTADAPTNFTQAERESLYAELASGAETGWDYSSRWCREPVINVSDNNPALRTLNTRAIIPVDLNSLLAGDHALLANLYGIYANSSMGGNSSSSSTNTSAMISAHQMIASELTEAVLDLNWDADKLWFYDFNTTGNDRSPVYTPAGTFALWQNITPEVLTTNETAAQAVFAGQRFIAGFYAGVPSVASLLYTGLNWDWPNSWPPHVYTSIKALETLGRNFPNATSFDGNVTLADFNQIPAGQLGINQTDLQPQPSSSIGNNSMSFSANVAAIQQGKPWWQQFAIEIANRYLQASFCSWYSTGGSIPGVLQSLNASQPGVAPNPTAVATIGNIFEKFNVSDVDAAGGGGEYEVVVGFVSRATLLKMCDANKGLSTGLDERRHPAHGRRVRSIPCCPVVPASGHCRGWFGIELQRHAGEQHASDCHVFGVPSAALIGRKDPRAFRKKQIINRACVSTTLYTKYPLCLTMMPSQQTDRVAYWRCSVMAQAQVLPRLRCFAAPHQDQRVPRTAKPMLLLLLAPVLAGSLTTKRKRPSGLAAVVEPVPARQSQRMATSSRTKEATRRGREGGQRG